MKLLFHSLTLSLMYNASLELNSDIGSSYGTVYLQGKIKGIT